MCHSKEITQIHFELVRGLTETGSCPSNAALAKRFGVSEEQIEERLCELSRIHGVVLHPYANTPWIVHPFSLTPTLNWVEGEGRSWWAPCIWCALGVSVIVGGETKVHTRIAAEAEPVSIHVRNGVLTTHHELIVHFAIPPALAWRNVHEHCSMVLAFRSESEIERWCSRHSLLRGEVVPIQQVAELARLWYGQHASPAWHKWSLVEADQIFRDAGLTSEFWTLEQRTGTF